MEQSIEKPERCKKRFDKLHYSGIMEISVLAKARNKLGPNGFSTPLDASFGQPDRIAPQNTLLVSIRAADSLMPADKQWSLAVEKIGVTKKKEVDESARYADMFAAIGTEARLRILRALLAAHPEGLVVGDIQSELGIPASTLSHHLEKLKNEKLVTVERRSTYLWYRANTEILQELLSFLFSECCTRNQAVKLETILACCR